MLNIEFISILFETPGTLMIAYAALSVHHRVLHEHTIDTAVFASMKREQRIGKLGVLLILIGFAFQLIHHLT
jgi:hypothetical protein